MSGSVRMGFPLTNSYVEVVVRDYLRSEGHSRGFGSRGPPGRSWWEGFPLNDPCLWNVSPNTWHDREQRVQ